MLSSPGRPDRTFSRVGVVVPAHDEEELLPACLAALDRAARAAPVPVDVVVALDSCTDGSAEVAAAAGVRTVALTARNVGLARAAGAATVLDGPTTTWIATTWVATTDADTVVPADWLVRHLAHAATGADVVVGTVEVADWTGWPVAVATAYTASYRRLFSVDGHGHVHGANLGLSGDTYTALGGFAPRALAEDHALVDAAQAAGRRVVRATDLAVHTSARRHARAVGGFSDHLRSLTA